MASTRSKGHRQEPKDKIPEIDMSWLKGYQPDAPEPEGSFTVGDIAKQENIKYNTAWIWVRRGLDAGSLEVVGVRRDQGNGTSGSGRVEKLYLSV